MGGNKLLLLHEGGASEAEVVAYGQRYGLTSEEQERKSLQFMQDPMWRSYGFNYPMGYALISSVLATAGQKIDLRAPVEKR